ncbi:hypothetical protein PsorP6_002033 [Peronosclerospora sorghi]|uniref:Uncharacterized protein n=1 Tax=Peronosclerospora sorghi TaxID=230839 RepID=A0ACC0WZ68_9STRA|nr:hypothetical protein PsorP6_002033 [Peronosclerospora sorghi]
MIFGIPCHPTRFEIAFTEPGDDDDADDTDINKWLLCPVPITEVGKTISAHSFLDVPRDKMRRSQLREKTKKSCKLFNGLTEPEGRLAATTA